MYLLKYTSGLQKVFILLMFISIALKILYIDWGLPNAYNHDELNHIEEALQVGSGKFEPDQLYHGTLITYLIFVEYGILYILGKITGNYLSTDDFLLSYLTEPTIFYLIGRITIVLLSIGSIFFTYLVGKKLFNEKVGIISAIFIAFSPTHFIQSTTVKDDIPATFFISLFFYIISLYFLYDDRSLKKDKLFYASGFALGLAIAAKLTAIPGLITFYVAFLLKELNGIKGYKKYLISLWNRRFIKGMFFVFVGFFIADPFAVINYRKFIHGILYMENEYAGMVTTIKFPQIFYFTNHLPNMIGIPLTVFFCTSVIYFVFRPSKKLILLLSFPISYYLIFNNAVGFAYFILTALPFIVILSSVFLDKITSVINDKWNTAISTVAMSFLIFLLIIPEALNTVRYINVLGSEDTRILSKRWIEDNIPSNKSILVEGAVQNLIVMSPHLKGNLDTLKDDFNFVIVHAGSGRLQKMLIDNFNNSENTYRLYKASQVLKPEFIDKYNPDYIITSGILDLDIGELDYRRKKKYYIQREAVYKEINQKYELIKRFEPFPHFRFYFPLFTSKDYDELKKIPLFSQQRQIIPGPEIKIFKKKI